jgi:hypothetical protein
VVAGGDKTYVDTSTAELKTIISVWGFRSEFLLRDADLAKIKARPRSSGKPTIHPWHRCSQVGCRAISDSRLEILDAGHGPWFGHPEKVAKITSEFAR